MYKRQVQQVLRPLAPQDLLDARVDVAAAADDAAAITLDGAAPAGAAAAPLADGVLADAARRGSIRMSADPASSRARTETLYALEAVATNSPDGDAETATASSANATRSTHAPDATSHRWSAPRPQTA